MSGSAVVIGSLHVDLIARADRFPGRGESVTGGAFSMAPGGKAGNQAIQLALCGIETTLVSRVGNDDFGRMLRSALQKKGVRIDRVTVDPDAPTGASTVFAAEGDYASIIAPGAANNVDRSDLEAARPEIERVDVVVLQRELEPAFVAEAIEFCANLGRPIVLNASPAPSSMEELAGIRLSTITWLIVNRVEAGILDGATIRNESEAVRVARRLHEQGTANVVITLGGTGSVWVGDAGEAFVPALKTTVVDTVGAGDAFLGVMVASLIRRLEIPVALRRACAAGAIAVGRAGAYDALPSEDEIDRKVKRVSNDPTEPK